MRHSNDIALRILVLAAVSVCCSQSTEAQQQSTTGTASPTSTQPPRQAGTTTTQFPRQAGTPQASPPPTAAFVYPPRKPVPFPKADPREYDTKPITKPPSLPRVPDYSGSKPKFEGGQFYPNLHHGECFTLTYSVREKPDQVYTWYMSALPQTGWKIRDKGTSPSCIQAEIVKDGLWCRVGIGPGQGQYKTTLSLRYVNNGKLQIPQ